MTQITAREFLERSGMDEPMAPGQVKYRQHVAEKEGNSYTVVFDWQSDHNKIRIEIRPGLSGSMPDKKELSQYAVWLQTENYVEFELGASNNNAKESEQEDGALEALAAATSGKASTYQMLASKLTKTIVQIGEKLNQVPIAVEGAKKMCRVLSKSFQRAGKAKA